MITALAYTLHPSTKGRAEPTHDENKEDPEMAETDRAEAIARLENEHDDIEEAMDDLLIFPSGEVFRRSLKLVESHFANEKAVMKEHGFEAKYRDYQMEDQQRILHMARIASEGGSRNFSKCRGSS
uniref:Hemerythrin-like domain-containing protein n=1 Tax=Trieres chinensis TaxID=1514140 RepID=A0A7S2A794_TRICV